MRPRFSLRYKFLSLTSILLVLSVLVHLVLSTQIFKQDKTELIYDLNRSLVTNIRNEIQTQVETSFGKLGLAAISKSGFSQLLSDETENLVLIMEYRTPESTATLYELTPHFQTYNIESEKLKIKFIESFGAHLEGLKDQGRMTWAFRSDENLPYLGMARVVIEEDSLGRKISQKTILGLHNLESLIKSVSTVQSSNVEIYTTHGLPLLNTKAEEHSLSLFQRAENSVLDTAVLTYKSGKAERMGAYSKSTDFVVLASSESEKVFSVVRQLVKRSVLFGLIVVSTAFLLILLFSKSITHPLDMLVGSMEKVSAGDLNLSLNIKTNDEISVLSKSFNQMIKDLKSSREALEETNRDLERKVADRTRRLEEQNRAVKEAQEALLKTTRLASVGEIAGRAAHEVLNPLTSIMARLEKVQKKLRENIKQDSVLLENLRTSWEADYQKGGFDELLASWKRPSEVLPGKTLLEEDIGVIKQVAQELDAQTHALIEDSQFLVSESQRINRIVSQMRSLSHVKRELYSESIHDLLSESVKIMADLFDRDGIKLREIFEAKLDVCDVNRDEFIQSITNMLRNSLQAVNEVSSPNGVISIKTFNRDEFLFIEIEDNGIGIEPTDHEKLFAAHFSTKNPSQGTGLGLSISRRFIRGFEGDIELVRSEPNRGSVFVIKLPLTKVQHVREYGT